MEHAARVLLSAVCLFSFFTSERLFHPEQTPRHPPLFLVTSFFISIPNNLLVFFFLPFPTFTSSYHRVITRENETPSPNTSSPPRVPDWNGFPLKGQHISPVSETSGKWRLKISNITLFLNIFFFYHYPFAEITISSFLFCENVK